MADGSADSLAGVSVVDPATVEIRLSRPDATFLHVMALNFASVVPREAVDAAGGDFGKNPVGTGAFRLGEWTIGQRLIFEKNPDYWRAGLPYLDTVTFEVGQEPIVALLRLQNGEVDVPGDGIPPAKFQEVMGDPAQAARVVEGGQLQTGYITLNVTVPPLDDVEVRRALNMAIDKDRITQIINGRAVPATQPLPPSMPGYTEGYAGYGFDPEKAREMLAEAGLPDGFDTELYVMNTDPNPRIAQAIQQDLSKIGVRAEIRSLAQANVIEAGGAGTAPMIWSGGMAWIADFPDPSNFYGPILGCSGAEAGGWNWSKFCDPALDAEATDADSMVSQDGAERLEMWSDVYMKVMDEAPWIPVFNEQRYTMKSARMGGDDSLYVDPVSIPVNYDYVYVTEVSGMCKACDYTIHGAQHHFGWDNSLAPAERVEPGVTLRVPLPRQLCGPARPVLDRGGRGGARFRAHQPRVGADLGRRRGAGRRAEGDARQLRPAGTGRKGLGLDREHSGLRPARGPVP